MAAPFTALGWRIYSDGPARNRWLARGRHNGTVRVIRRVCARDDVAATLAVKLAALPVVVAEVAPPDEPTERPRWQLSGDRDVLYVRMLTALTCSRENYAAALGEVEGMFTTTDPRPA